MAAITVGEIWAGLRIDGAQAKKDAAKAGGDAGEAAGKTMGERIGTELKKRLPQVIGGAVGGALGAAGRQMVGLGDAMAYLGARTGKSRDELAGYEDRLQAIHRANYGNDYQDIADAIAQVEANLGTTGDETDDVVKKGLALRQVFGQDIPRQMKGAQNLITNFGVTGGEAMDLITRGLQLGGEGAEDLLDTFDEYSGSFRDMGYDAVTFLDILLDGLANGARNSDIVADAIKELDIRMRDGSKASREALTALGIDWRRFEADLGSGALTGVDAMRMINDGLRAVGDTTRQEQLGVALWGTKWEDAGAGVILSLDQVDGKVEGLDGSAQQLADTIGSGPTSAFEAWRREIVGTVTDLANKLVPGLRELAPILAGFGPFLAPALAVLGTFIGKGIGRLAGQAIESSGAQAFGEGLRALWRRVSGSRVVVGAIAAAGAASSAIYSAAESVASAFFAGIKGLWGRLLAAPGVRTAIAAAGVASGAIYAGAEAGGGMLGAIASKLRVGLPAIARGAIGALGVLAIPVALNFVLRDNSVDSKDDYSMGGNGVPFGMTGWDVEQINAQRARMMREGAGVGTAAWEAFQQGIFDGAGQAASSGGLDWSKLGGAITRGAEQMEGAFRQTGTEAGSAVAQGVVAGVEATAPIITGTWGTIADAAVQTTREMMAGVVERIRGSKDAVADAMADIRWAMEHPLAAAKARSRVLAAAAGEDIGNGLRSKKPWIRQAAVEALTGLVGTPDENGKLTGGVLGTLPGKAGRIGAQAATALLRNLSLGLGSYDITLNINGQGPTRHFQNPDGSGGVEVVPRRARGGPVKAGHPYIVGDGGRPEVMVPRTDGFVHPSVSSFLSSPEAPAYRMGMTGTTDLGNGTVRHVVGFDPGTLAEMRAAGFDEERVARIVDEMVGEPLRTAAGSAHIGYRNPRGT